MVPEHATEPIHQAQQQAPQPFPGPRQVPKSDEQLVEECRLAIERELLSRGCSIQVLLRTKRIEGSAGSAILETGWRVVRTEQ